MNSNSAKLLSRKISFTGLLFNSSSKRKPFPVKYKSFSSSAVHRGEDSYTVEQCGCLYSENYALYFKNSNGEIVSPFHDIPLVTTKKNIYNMIVEIPRWSNAKMEINAFEKMNPVMQDIKNGELRFVANCFPHNGYMWNYGALPQTWEDPNHYHHLTQAKGDSDPIDVCEIGSKIHATGSVIQVKILGVLALIDEGETDWKIIAIDVKDPVANEINNIYDVERIMPGLLEATVHWYTIYKIPFGSPPNKFAFEGEFKDAAFAHDIVKEVHEQWKKLMVMGESANQIQKSCTMYRCPYTISQYEAHDILKSKPPEGNPATFDSAVNKWHYITKIKCDN